MRRARRSRERGARARVPVIGARVAPPGYGGNFLVDVGLRSGGGVAGYGVEVGGEGDFGFVGGFVVGFEGCGEDFGVGVVVDVVECWSPFVGILVSSSALLELLGGFRLDVQYTERSLGFSPDGQPVWSCADVGRSFVTASEP